MTIAQPDSQRTVSAPHGARIRSERRRRFSWFAAFEQDRVLAALVVLALIVSVAAVAYYGSRGGTLAYGDARARLDIARRVFDNLQLGFVQLGTVWLPLHMLLLLPLVFVEPLWHTGAAGIVISAAAYIGTVAVLYLVVREATGSRFGAALAGLIALANANFIYMQATPMSEAPYLFFSSAGCYCLLRWARNRQLGPLVGAGFLLDLAALIRYDGWFAVAAGAVAVLLIAWRRADGGRSARAVTAGFCIIACYGIVLFVLYNQIYFGNALAFAAGAGSAASFYAPLAAAAGYATRGNLLHAVMAFSWTSIDAVGAGLFALGCAGAAFTARRFRLRPAGIVLYVFATGYVFNILSLFLGQSILYNKHVTPAQPLLNTRYGLMVLPAVAVFAGVLASIHFLPLRAALAAVVAAQSLALFLAGPPITLQDPLGYVQAAPDAAAARDYLKHHYDGGQVLIDFRYSDGDAFYMNLPMSRFLHEGVKRDGNPYVKAAGDLPRTPGTPSLYARWVYGRGDEPLLQRLELSDDFRQNFVCVFQSRASYVYELRGPGVSRDPACRDVWE